MTLPWQKIAAAMGSALPDPNTDLAAASPLPQPSVPNKPAPGQTGPRGLAPRTTYSRVNTGIPQIPDVGASAQKSLGPRGLESLPTKVAHSEDMMATVTDRPSLQDLVKQAMAGTIEKVDITAEATRQLLNQSEVATEEVKQASSTSEHIPTEHIEKLADAIGYLADQFEKEATGPGEGPGTLGTQQATSSEKNIDAGELGGKATPAPGMQSSGVAKDPANAMATNDSMMHGEQPVDPMKNKSASASLFEQNLQRLMKLAEGSEDNEEGGRVGGGKDVPPPATESGQGVPSEPGDVNSQKRLISSNEAAINYTKREAKADAVSDANKVWSEQAMKDPVLNRVFDHSGAAGVKTSMAQDAVKTAAAQALLMKLAASCGDKKCDGKEKGKEKDSMLDTPQGQSGFSAATMGRGMA